MLKCGTLVLLASLLMLSACGALPSLEGRTTSQALLSQDTTDTTLGQSIQPLMAQHPDLSGVHTLSHPLDAFASRMLLITTAQRSIDIQYYIWRDDITGNMMLRALHEAAKRQVRVRLLLDDNGTAGLDDKLAALTAHPNVEVRLFNPFTLRTFKPLGFVTDFRRLNRRMHNKSLTVDGHATIVGGRNIGDEYFGATQGIAFADLDVLVVGKVVDEVSQDFDLYWNSVSAFPIETLVRPAAKSSTLDDIQRSDPSLRKDAKRYLQAIGRTQFIEKLLKGELDFEWAPVRMVSDDPAKVLAQAPRETMLLARLGEVLAQPQSSIDLISPYFVPTEKGVDAFSALAQQGVQIRILTNAMEATDVATVHAGYAKYREPLLKTGIELFEMKRQSGAEPTKDKAGPFGSSGSSLHAKTFAVDGKRIFVGSFNFDPRSAELNTELGFLIESTRMAQEMSHAFTKHIPFHAYKVERAPNGGLIWRHESDSGMIHLTQEPANSVWQRLSVKFMSLLPIEPLL